jgi:hypothetical protein
MYVGALCWAAFGTLLRAAAQVRLGRAVIGWRGGETPGRAIGLARPDLVIE